jgi:hypothetical protein
METGSVEGVAVFRISLPRVAKGSRPSIISTRTLTSRHCHRRVYLQHASQI